LEKVQHMPPIVVFHSVLGLRPAIVAFAERLRGAGYAVVTPDLFDGRTFETIEAGVGYRDAVGIDTLTQRAGRTVAGLPSDIVPIGFSMGAALAQLVALTNPVRGVVLMHGAKEPATFGYTAWPAVPTQVHYAEHDEALDKVALLAFNEQARASGAMVEAFAYDAGGHLFEDPDLEGYDSASARLETQRVLDFLARLA
jgi:dienelactone hydrolase